MAGLVEVFFDETFTPTESGYRFASGGGKHFGDFVTGSGYLQATPAAAESGLDGNGKPVHIDKGKNLVGVRDGVNGSGCEWGTDLFSDVAGADLVPEALDGVGSRPNPDDAGVHNGSGKVGVFRKEPVSGVNRIGTGAGGGFKDFGDNEVRVGARGPIE